MSNVKSHKSAIVLVPKVSEELLGTIQNIRRKYDKAFKRWMPHVNLIYPFVEREDDSFKKEVANIKKCFTLCGVNKFDMKFNSESVGFFEHTATFNLFLKPFPVDSSDVIADCDVGSRNQESESLSGSTKAAASSTMDSKEQPLGYVDPFSQISQGLNTITPSLFDLHAAKDNSIVGTEHVNDASFSQFWDKSYACYNSETPKKSAKIIPETPKMVPKEKKTDQFKNFSSEDIEHFDQIYKDNDLERIRKLPALQRMQASLVRVFPDFDDLNTISEAGFQPHLTLGQFKKMNLNKHLAEIKEALFEDGNDEIFTADEIAIITRKSAEDPFEIQAIIPLPDKNSNN